MRTPSISVNALIEGGILHIYSICLGHHQSVIATVGDALSANGFLDKIRRPRISAGLVFWADLSAMKGPTWLALLASFASVPMSLADFVIDNGQTSVVDNIGISVKTSQFSTKDSAKSVPKLDLKNDHTLKIVFDISSNSKSAEPTPPRQVNLLATGLDTNLHWVTVVKTRGAGKAKWELDLARAPTDFLSLSRSGEILLELIIGDFSASHAPLRFKLSTLQIPKELLLNYPYWDTKDGKAPSALELDKYYVQPELAWTFRPPRKKDNALISLAFVLIVSSPWAVMLTYWSKLSTFSTPSFKLTSTPSISTILFIATLISEEVLILTYWASLRLYQYLPIALFLSLPLIVTGRTALSELRTRRKKAPINGSYVSVAKLVGDPGKRKAE
ncbi:hypothetical protein O181_034358 [Austropuccinia psidii MF-1]|uniref:Ribophorin II C-terminal domain-containing protein n=1 Tax=Austropuccinia psidii MF-1 TaxID=1389203 RepID=A0A9Q3D3B3_9BASI|nr:hypothetical protein [Austropuccinia psidii MF-1]